MNKNLSKKPEVWLGRWLMRTPWYKTVASIKAQWEEGRTPACSLGELGDGDANPVQKASETFTSRRWNWAGSYRANQSHPRETGHFWKRAWCEVGKVSRGCHGLNFADVLNLIKRKASHGHSEDRRHSWLLFFFFFFMFCALSPNHGGGPIVFPTL